MIGKITTCTANNQAGMRYKLKQGTAKKLREQFYLIMLFWGVIWILMALLFHADENKQTLLIYLAASVIIIPYSIVRQVTPFFLNLQENVNNAYFEISGTKVVFNYFHNLKKFDQEKVQFRIDDIVHVKKAFRRDDAVKKLTLTLKDKTKLVVEDFDDMESLLETIFIQSELE